MKLDKDRAIDTGRNTGAALAWLASGIAIAIAAILILTGLYKIGVDVTIPGLLLSVGALFSALYLRTKFSF